MTPLWKALTAAGALDRLHYIVGAACMELVLTVATVNLLRAHAWLMATVAFVFVLGIGYGIWHHFKRVWTAFRALRAPTTPIDRAAT